MRKYSYKVSVIIPVYKTEKYLEETVDSLIKQNLKEIEIVLIDDASPDNSGELCNRLSEQYENVCVIHKDNEGLGLTRNKGIEVANGEYIAFIDSDDKLNVDYLSTLYSKAIKYNLDICYSGGYIIFSDETKTQTQTIEYSYDHDLVFDSEATIKDCLARTISNGCHTNDVLPGSSCMSLYRLDFLKENNLIFLSERIFLSEDVWFNLDCLNKAKRVGYIPYIGYQYRYNQSSLSRGYRPERFEGLIRSIEMLEDKCKSLNLSNYQGRVAMYFWVNFEKCINQEVRYSVKDGLQNIRLMCENEITREMLEYLNKEKLNDKLHGLLCKILYKRKYRMCYVLLFAYNFKMHKN